MVNYDKEKIFFTLSKAKKKLVPLILGLKKNPVIAFIAISLALVMIFFAVGSGGGRSPLSHPLQEATVPFAMEEEGMTGVMESVDPRDVWTAKIEQKVQDTKYALAQQFEEKNKAADIELVRIKEELLLLKSLMEQQQQLIENQQMAASLNLSNSHSNSQESASLKETKILGKSLGLFTKKYGNKKRNTKEYITSGTFARAVLMTGIVVGTGSNSAANPEPIMLRLTDAGIFSKGGRTEQIKEAILIGDCSGDLSSERARCRLQTLSLENARGEIVERPVQGWLVGEDGRFGVRGKVVDKSSDMLRLAMLNGVLGGFSQFLQNQSTKGVFPISPLTGQQNSLSGANTLRGGMAHGAGDAFSKMADFVMERFNSMSPQIVIDSAREVDVVFKHGVDLNNLIEGGHHPADGNLGGANGYSNNISNRDYSNYQTNVQDTNNPNEFGSFANQVPQLNPVNYNEEPQYGF